MPHQPDIPKGALKNLSQEHSVENISEACRSTLPSFDVQVGINSEFLKETLTMRFMVIVKATKESEAGVLPDTKMLTEMGKFNEELVKAGVMLAGEGLQPSSKGAESGSPGKSAP